MLCLVLWGKRFGVGLCWIFLAHPSIHHYQVISSCLIIIESSVQIQNWCCTMVQETTHSTLGIPNRGWNLFSVSLCGLTWVLSSCGWMATSNITFEVIGWAGKQRFCFYFSWVPTPAPQLNSSESQGSHLTSASVFSLREKKKNNKVSIIYSHKVLARIKWINLVISLA